MKTFLFSILLMAIFSNSLYSQSGSINNTLGTGGSFIIKDVSANTFLTLDQATGYLTLNKSLSLPATTSSTLGVIYKGSQSFIHNYQASGTSGQNTFVGINAGNFTMPAGGGDYGSYNTGVGYSALSSNSWGAWNSAFGTSSLSANTGGFHNSAFGMSSMYSNTTGNSNSAAGYQSLYSNTSGQWNSAFGGASLHSNTTGTRNSAFGEGSLQAITTSSYNAAFGQNSLFSQTTGSQNSAFGWSAGGNVSTGSNLTLIGYNAGANVYTGSNLTVIGANATASALDATNEITLGFGITTLRCGATSITSTSDARDKKNIQDLQPGIDFLMKLKPRQFNWDRREWYANDTSDGSKMQNSPTAGFIAQELDKVQMSENAEWLNLVLKSNPNKLEATYGNLLPIVVKAIQDLKKENDELKDRLTKFEKMQTLLVAEIENLRANNNEMTKVSLGTK
jgi:hypothetical protein